MQYKKVVGSIDHLADKLWRTTAALLTASLQCFSCSECGQRDTFHLLVKEKVKEINRNKYTSSQESTQSRSLFCVKHHPAQDSSKWATIWHY